MNDFLADNPCGSYTYAEFHPSLVALSKRHWRLFETSRGSYVFVHRNNSGLKLNFAKPTFDTLTGVGRSTEKWYFSWHHASSPTGSVIGLMDDFITYEDAAQELRNIIVRSLSAARSVNGTI